MLLPAQASLALPAITNVRDCAVFSHSVAPFLPQLATLPVALYVALKHALLPSSTPAGVTVPSLVEVYAATNPFVSALCLSLVLAPVFLVVSEATGNYSWVDRSWSILPAVYVAHYALWARTSGIVDSTRVDVVLVIAAIWSVRLTFNYWRKGGYSRGTEDYRWAVIKERVGKKAMFAFNVVFIATMQSVLLCLFTSPTYILLLISRIEPSLTSLDTIMARLLIILIFVEYFADQQQWEFQRIKAHYLKTAKVPTGCGYTAADLDRGFIVSGLWAWSRHPNFAAEQAIWLSLYQWATMMAGRTYNWTLLGAGSLLFLFQGSTRLTEHISARKYPDYKEYQRLVGMFVPSGLGARKRVDQLVKEKEEEQGKKKN